MKKSSFLIVIMCIAFILPYSTDALAGIETSFLYTLSDFGGRIPINRASFSVDEQRKEIYVVDFSEEVVRVFDDRGMEIYEFGDDGDLEKVVAVAVREDGNIFVLAKGIAEPTLILCDFRGKPLSKVELKELPADFSGFIPDHLVYRRGLLYLLDSSAARIVVTDGDGRVQTSYDLLSLMEVAEKKRETTTIFGFSVDRQGNILFTVPVLFHAFRLTPEGELTSFGSPGSSPGTFNLATGIVSDDRGYYYVADRLKSAIIVFDKNYQFVTQFGYRGSKPENLIAPQNLALDVNGRLYVSQLANRGVSVFHITYTE